MSQNVRLHFLCQRVVWAGTCAKSLGQTGHGLSHCLSAMRSGLWDTRSHTAQSVRVLRTVPSKYLKKVALVTTFSTFNNNISAEDRKNLCISRCVSYLTVLWSRNYQWAKTTLQSAVLSQSNTPSALVFKIPIWLRPYWNSRFSATSSVWFRCISVGFRSWWGLLLCH